MIKSCVIKTTPVNIATKKQLVAMATHASHPDLFLPSCIDWQVEDVGLIRLQTHARNTHGCI